MTFQFKPAVREHAAKLLLLVPEIKEAEQVSSLLFLAYLRGWQDAVKDELAFTTRLQEIARSIGNG